jgi:hypothetical protein
MLIPCPKITAPVKVGSLWYVRGVGDGVLDVVEIGVGVSKRFVDAEPSLSEYPGIQFFEVCEGYSIPLQRRDKENNKVSDNTQSA